MDKNEVSFQNLQHFVSFLCTSPPHHVFVFALSYCPSIFILRPGQHLHINKGRLHCFRKLTPDRLRQDDCHALLRQQLINELKSTPDFDSYWGYVCLSIAFDW